MDASERGLQVAGRPALDARVESGLRWSAARQTLTGVIGVVGVLAYSRVLQPADLGAVGLAFLVYDGLFLLVQAPVRDAVVYYQEQEGDHASAAFWLLLGFSGAVVAPAMALAGQFARFYQSPFAAGLTRAMMITFLLQSVAVVPAALLLKRFQFAVHESLQTAYFLLLFAGWVSLALAGFGPWSLVIPSIIASAFWSLTTWRAVGFRPALRPTRRAFGDILRFSRSLFGSKFLVYLKAKMDNAAVGTLGEDRLGWYSFGEDQSAFATIGLGAVVAQVALPALAAARDRLEEFRRIYLEMLRLTATLSTPMQIGAFVLADLGIVVIFGEQWLAAVPVFHAYLGFRLVNTLLEITDAASSAIGRPDIRLAVDAAQLPFFVAGTWFGLTVWGGIAGVAWSLAIVRAVAGLAYFAVMMRVTGLKIGETLRYLLPNALAGALMGIGVQVARGMEVLRGMIAPMRQPFLADALNLIVLTLIGAAGYFAILFALDRAGSVAVARMAWEIVVPKSLRRWIAGRRKLPRPSAPSGSAW